MDTANRADTNAILKALFLRAEEVLGKMLIKLERTRMPLQEKVRMINALHAFVGQWEAELADVKLPPELVQQQQQQAVPAARPKSHGDEIMDVMQKLGLNGDDGGGGAGRAVKNGGRSMVAVPVPQEESEPVFEVLEQSLKEYTPGQPGTCFITHTCPGSRRFFMMDRTDRDEADRIDRMLVSLQNVTTRREDLPDSPRRIFGVEVKGEIFRAVRSLSIPAWLWLLDTGAVLPYEESMLLFELPEFYRRRDPFARCCELVDVTDRKFRGADLGQFLEVNLLSGREFEVVRVRGKVLYVNLGRAVARKRNGEVKKKEPPAEYRISEKTLTQEQLDVLYEEPLSTTNAMKATMGYVPQDDGRICPHYEPALEGCFKGSRCKLLHVAKDPDGWTRDQTLHKVKIRAQLNEPKVGSVVHMIPTTIVSVEEFYAHLEVAENGAKLVELQALLNDPKNVKEFRPLDHKPYKPNQTGRCVISSVVTGGQRSFCIVDRNQWDSTKLLAAMQHSHGARLAQLPARPGEVFGVFLEGTLYRAVRNRPPLEGSRMREDYIRLLDTGEVLAFEEGSGAMLCNLSEYYRKLPAFAIRCVLVNVLDDPFSCDDLNRYLRKNLHAAQHYKVVSAEGHVLYLRLSQLPIVENPFNGDLSVDSATSSLSNNSSDSESSREPTMVAPPSPLKKPTTPRWDIFKVDNPEKSNGTPIIRPAGIPPDQPTTPPKKASILKQPESDDYVVPPVGSHLYLVPKFIRDVEHFWCHVVEGDRVNADLMELEMKLNDSEYSRTFRKFDSPPAFAEPVFAKYTDRKWYRAEVAEYFAEDSVKVFYVDYGNCELVRTDEMRRWDDRFSYLPYQAVLCRLADVKAVRPFHKQAVVEMNRVLLNQRVLAKIVNNGTPWEVILYDKDGFNVATGLVLAGLAKKLYENAAELAEKTRLINAQQETARAVRGR